MRKILLLTVLLTFTCSYSQKINPNIFTEIYLIPASDSTSQLYYLYKIPINDLIFSKNNNLYEASIQIMIELSDSNSQFIQRQFNDRSFSLEDFSLTSDPQFYVEGAMSVPIENRSMIVTSRIYDRNSQKEFFTKEHIVQKYKKEEANFLTPIVLHQKSIKCGEYERRVLPNYGSFIPFDNSSYDILFPVNDSTLKKLYVKVITKKDTIFNGVIEQQESWQILFSECDGKVIITSDPESKTYGHFWLTELTTKLKEGQIEIILSKNEYYSDKKSFKPIVKWMNKPKSLRDSESAIRLLRFILKDDSIKQILKSGDNYDSLLYRFWNKMDPSPETQYNELMAQYYERVDYSLQNFSTITGLSGVETDRAKVYIRYGKPSFSERGSNGDGKVFETWFYPKLQQKFIFIDEKGTGEFILKNTI